VTQSISSTEERVKALGRLTTCYALGSIIGPAIGGYLGVCVCVCVIFHLSTLSSSHIIVLSHFSSSLLFPSLLLFPSPSPTLSSLLSPLPSSLLSPLPPSLHTPLLLPLGKSGDYFVGAKIAVAGSILSMVYYIYIYIYIYIDFMLLLAPPCPLQGGGR
jgi:hypothetical protein